MVSADRATALRRRTVVFVVISAVFGIGTFVLAGFTFSGRLGFAHPLLIVLFVLPIVASGVPALTMWHFQLPDA